MNLYSYRKESKKQIYYVNGQPLLDNIILQDEYNAKTTFKDLTSNSYQGLKNLIRTSNLARLIIPSILIITGVFFIYRQFFPEIKQFFEKNSGYLAQGNISPVTDSYVNYTTYISNPSGLSDLVQRALQENILAVDDVSLKYSGNFYISIPSIGIHRLPVEANVDSSSEESYNLALQDSLAHFKGTGLPISDVQNNIVIYGHSASPNYNPRRTDPEVAFSYLPELKVGDDIIIEIEGKEYRFKMYRSKIVEPDDTSVITGTKGKRTLTLFTCYPIGANSQRYVALAREV